MLHTPRVDDGDEVIRALDTTGWANVEIIPKNPVV
jgi:hypothetical protein